MAEEAVEVVPAPSWRRELFRQMDPGAWDGSGLSPFNAVLTALVVACVTLAVLETEPTLTRAAPWLFGGAEIVFGAVFSIEYVLRLWAAPEDPRWSGRWGRLRYALSPWALIDLAALAPALLAGLGQQTLMLRALRLARLLRVARLGALSDAAEALSLAVRARRYELLLSLVMGGLLLVVSAVLLYFAEGRAQPEQFGSIPRAMWWAVATLTTVGYGDAFPVTLPGKILAAVCAVAGIGFVALPTGILASAMSDVLQSRRSPPPTGAGDERRPKDGAQTWIPGSSSARRPDAAVD